MCNPSNKKSINVYRRKAERASSRRTRSRSPSPLAGLRRLENRKWADESSSDREPSPCDDKDVPKDEPDQPPNEPGQSSSSGAAQPNEPVVAPAPMLAQGQWWTIGSGGAMYMGTAGPFGPQLFIGTQEAAREKGWLNFVNIGVLVCCKTGAWPNKTGIHEIKADSLETDKTDPDSLRDLAQSLKDLSVQIDWLASEGTRGVLFWCKAGRHRSAAALAAYLRCHSPGLRADTICTHLKRLKKNIEFFDTVKFVGGKPRPPFLQVFRMLEELLADEWA